MDTTPTSQARTAYSNEEAVRKAREFLTETYGKPKDLSEEARDAYHVRLGMIVDLFDTMFPH